MRRSIKPLQRFISAILTLSTLLWSLGVSLLMTNVAAAATAITVTGPNELIPPSGAHLPASSFDMPILRVALTQATSGETLTSLAVTIANNTGSVTNNTLADHIASLSVYQDTNNNGVFDPGVDLLAGTVSPVQVATTTTVIPTASNNAIATSGALPSSFFITIKTAAGWGGADSIKVNMATAGIVTSVLSPALAGPFTGQNAVDAQLGGSGGGFGVQKVSYLSPTTVDVNFSDFLDLNSGQTTSTANYTFAGSGTAAVSSVTVLPDNKSVRVVANGGNMVGNGSATLAVSASVKNQNGIANGTTVATPLFDSFQPLVISEIKVGGTSDQYDEFVEVYNRSTFSYTATSSLALHFISADGTVDSNVPLTWMTSSTGSGMSVKPNSYLLIAPITSPASSTADVVYSTSTMRQIVPNGALYISNSAASSTAVIDRVCWGTHSAGSDCAGQPAPALGNDGTSIERKANSGSTSATMGAGGADVNNGNSQNTSNNAFDFVARATPRPRNSANNEAPGGGSFGGGDTVSIQHASIFNATASSTLNIIARMTSNTGPLTPSKTLLIYCTSGTTCAPASSTPVYGTSIGSGWFRFTLTNTSSPWSNFASYFDYYLQATDNNSPAKTRVFTNDPNFDPVDANTNPGGGSQSGIQTQALQQSKALAIKLSQGNQGSATFTGTINNSSGTAVSGATVWLEGTQYAATTGNDGTFSLPNVGPAGGRQLKVAKDGFADQSLSVFVPASGLVNLPTITLFSGTMGSGGDYNQPRVTNSNPFPGSNTFPSNPPSGSAGPAITVNFSKAMDATTIANSDATQSNSTIYLTTAGSASKIAGSVAAGSGNTSAVFTPTSALTAGQPYTLYLTPGVKDTAGNPLAGNSNAGAYQLNFATAGQFFSNFSAITAGGGSFGSGNAFPPFVQGSQPAPGKTGFSLNNKVFVNFSQAMQNTPTNLANAQLLLVTNQFTASESTAVVATTNSLDTSGKIVVMTPVSNLTASAHYRIVVLGGILSAKGIPLGPPTPASNLTTVFYRSDFDAGTATDVAAPTVNGTIPTAGASGISTTKPIIIVFSKAMNPTTITANSIVVNLGSTAVSGQMTYDPSSWKATFIPDYALTPTSTYTINVTTAVTDLAGNALASALLQTFTTGSPDTTMPTLVSAQANDFSAKITYSKPMLAVAAGDLNYSGSAINPSNYTFKVVNSSGASLSTLTLSTPTTLTYDSATRSVIITYLPPVSGFTPGTTLFNIVAGSAVKDIGFNTVDPTANAVTSTAQSSAQSGDFSGGNFMPMKDATGNFVQGGSFGPPPNFLSSFSGSGIGFIPSAKVLPNNPTAGASTIYSVDLPISKQIPAGGFIDITFPDGVDVSNAVPAANSPKNSDLDGPGLVVIGTTEGSLSAGWTTGGAANDGVIVNPTSRTVRVILGATATRSQSGDTHDFLRFDLDGIVNSSISNSVDSAGNTPTVATKSSDGTLLESFTSESYFNTAAGSLTLRGQVLAGASGLNSVNVYLMAPMTGRQSTSTAASRWGGQAGEFLFQNLNAGTYMLGVDQYFKSGGTSYTASFPTPVVLNATNCASNVCTTNVSATSAATGATLTLQITGTFSNDAIDIFAGGPGAYRLATSTLNGTLTNDTSQTIKLNANGKWVVGFGPSMKGGMFNQSGPVSLPAWLPATPKEVTVTGCSTTCVVTPNLISFSVTAAGQTIKYTVQDTTGSKIGQAYVSAYALGGGSSGGTAAADGTGSMSLGYGTYKIAAGVPGMPPGVERSVDIRSVSGVDKVFIDGSSTGIALSAMTASQLVLLVPKTATTYTITGKVTDGTNPVANAPVSAYRTDGTGHTDNFTNSSGDYTLYVSNGAWTVSAFLPQQYGQLPTKSVTVAGANVSGQNFQPSTSVNYATITKSVGIDANGDGLFEAGEGQSNVQVTVEGTTSASQHYINTVLTDTNGSSTLKVPPGTYTMKAYSPTIGNFPAFSSSLVVASDGSVTSAPGDLLAPQSGSVTINILDKYGNATTTDKIAVEFQQIGGKFDAAQAFATVSSTVMTLPIYSAGADNIALGTVTSTNPSNFYLMKLAIPGIANNSYSAYGGSGTIMATSSASNGLYKVEVNGNKTVNVILPDVDYMSGSVQDNNGSAIPGATVHVQNKATGEAMEVKADGSGNYSAKLSSGNYMVQAEKNGYLDTATTVAVSASGTLATALTTATVANRTITGSITAGGAAVVGASVKGQMLGGGTVVATTLSDGSYTLNVVDGNWKVSASAEGYAETSYTAVVAVSGSSVTGVSIALSSTASLNNTQSVSMTPQTGGALTDTSANFSLTAPGTAISTSANSYTLAEKETSNVLGGGEGKPIGGKAKAITSYTNDNKLVGPLNNNVGVSAVYSVGDLTTALRTLSTTTVENIKMSSWDATANNWENLPTTVAYKDSSGNFLEPTATLSNVSTVSFTGQTLHFSVFNPTTAVTGLFPSAPSGITVSPGNGSVTVSWTAPTTNSDNSTLTDLLGYELYRSTSASGPFTQVNTSDITSGAQYSDTSVTNGNTYYYKVTAANTGGSESALSTVSAAALPSASASGNFSSGAGGAGGGAATAVTTPAATTPAAAPQPTSAMPSAIALAPSASTPIQSAVGVPSYNFTKTLRSGSSDKQVKQLQIVLKALGFLPVGTKPTTFFGKLTMNALKKFQKANGLKPTGILDKSTRQVLSSVGGGAPATVSPAPATASNPAPGAAAVFTSTLKLGSSGSQVKMLQLKLKSLGLLSATPNGRFGPATLKAVKAFQKANGLPAVGLVGKATRALLNNQ